MAPGVAVVLGIVLGLVEIMPASWRLQRAAWRRSEGPAGQGLVLVKAGVASESRAHAVRGVPRKVKYEGGTGSWQYSSWSSAEHVLHCITGSHSVATAFGMAEQ